MHLRSLLHNGKFEEQEPFTKPFTSALPEPVEGRTRVGLIILQKYLNNKYLLKKYLYI